MAGPSFDEIAKLIAEVTGVDRSRITPATRFGEDLGVAGDDGVNVLDFLAKQYGTNFERPSHGGRYLFDPESFDLISPIFRWVLGRPSKKVIQITVGDLYLAVMRGRWEDPPWPAS